MRRVFVVLSAHAFPYARHCLGTLLARSAEAVDLTLVTDDEADRAVYQPFLEGLACGPHRWRVVVKAECDALEDARFGARPGLKALRAQPKTKLSDFSGL